MANKPPAHGPEELAKATEHHHAALTAYTTWCERQQIPPGIAQNAAIDFVILMVLHNFPLDASEQLDEICTRMRTRLGELKGAQSEPTGSTEVRPSAARTPGRRKPRARHA